MPVAATQWVDGRSSCSARYCMDITTAQHMHGVLCGRPLPWTCLFAAETDIFSTGCSSLEVGTVSSDNIRSGQSISECSRVPNRVDKGKQRTLDTGIIGCDRTDENEHAPTAVDSHFSCSLNRALEAKHEAVPCSEMIEIHHYAGHTTQWQHTHRACFGNQLTTRNSTATFQRLQHILLLYQVGPSCHSGVEVLPCTCVSAEHALSASESVLEAGELAATCGASNSA